MKRDLDLFRRILLDVEALPPGKFLDNIKYPEYEKEIVDEHIKLLHDAHFIDATTLQLGSPKTLKKYQINRLTNLGYEFLKNSRNATAWNSLKEHVLKPGVSFALASATEYLKMKAKEKLNIR